MRSKSPGLFHFSGYDTFAAHAEKTVTAFRDAKGRIAYLGDGGSGFLSKGLAELLVVHIQKAIGSGGSSIGKTYEPLSSAYEASLVAQGKKYKLLQNTGWLLASIKVLNRRYSEGRGAVAGIDPKAVVPVKGWKGYEGGSIKVSTYAAAVTFGSPGNDYRGDIPARPVIVDAIESFMSGLGPDISKRFFQQYVKSVDKAITEKMRFGGSLGTTLEAGQGSRTTGSYLGAEDIGNMSVGTASDSTYSDPIYDAEAKAILEKSAKAYGLSAADIAKWAKV